MLIFLAGVAVLLLIGSIGVPLGFALLLVGIGGFAILHPGGVTVALSLAGQQVTETATSYQFAALPLFIAMGIFAARAGLADEVFEAARRWVGHFRGGMAMATIIACGGFAAVSGSSAATAATMAKAALPPMRRSGYADSLSSGTIVAGGTLGILIPPSGMMIIYGLLTEQDISRLFMAGIVPGLLMMASFVVTIAIVTSRQPNAGPRGERFRWCERFKVLLRVWGIIVLFGVIMSGLFFGIFTTNEAGGIGAGGALLFALLRRKLTLRGFVDTMTEAAVTSATIFVLIIGASMFNQFVNFSGMPEQTIQFIDGLNVPPPVIIAAMLIIYLILGIFIEGAAMIFLTVPIFVPIVSALGFDLIWWGVIVLIAVEISVISPPLGLNFYILKAAARDIPMSQIFKGVMPFFYANILVLALVALFPALSLYLPSLIGR